MADQQQVQLPSLAYHGHKGTQLFAYKGASSCYLFPCPEANPRTRAGETNTHTACLENSCTATVTKLHAMYT